MQRFLKETKLGRYQRVPLGHGLEIPGSRDCTDSFRAAVHDSLAGKSVLDVGCAYGAMCYMAEEAGASRVVGVDHIPDIVNTARRIAALKESQVEFLCLDVDTACIEDSFDFVLCYNVIHHLRHPLWVIHNLANACRETLVLEFSTLHGRFLKLSGMTEPIKGPLLSPTSKEIGLCLNPEALEIIIPWYGPFELVRSMVSPKQSDYRLMVFRRT